MLMFKKLSENEENDGLHPLFKNRGIRPNNFISNTTNNIIQSINVKANESKKIDITLPNISIQTNKSGE
jgi:hypothetical protein